MCPENKPLTPGWLRHLRDAHAREGPEQHTRRRAAALVLAHRLGLDVAESAAFPVPSSVRDVQNKTPTT